MDDLIKRENAVRLCQNEGKYSLAAMMDDPEIVPSESRWFPIQWGEPAEDGVYLVTIDEFSYPSVISYSRDLFKVDPYAFSNKKGKSGWYDFDMEVGHYEVDEITAWMPLPEIYKGGPT